MNETLRVVDCDVHPFPIGGANSIMRYLPKPWQERFLRKGSFLSNNGAPMRYTNPNGIVVRADARSPAGKLAGSDPHYVIADLIEANGIDIVLLNCLDSAKLCAPQSGPDESIVLAQAYNEHFVQEWLPRSPHLAYAMMVPTQDPQAAAAEIRRIGTHLQVAAVHLPPHAHQATRICHRRRVCRRDRHVLRRQAANRDAGDVRLSCLGDDPGDGRPGRHRQRLGVVLGAVMLQLLQSWFLEDLSGWIRDLGATVNVAWMQQIDLDTIDRADLRPDPRLHDVVPAGGADPRHPQGTQTELRTMSPPYVGQVFEIIQQINRQGTTIFMVEQNANLALSIAHCAYVLQTGKVVLSSSVRELRRNRAIQEAYLGELQVT
jgi:hypothetical protein